MAATETSTVIVTIDDRELVVPKGTPLVIAAAEAGIEIPVFCYEPRLGAPVGACRMCLVEVELGGKPMPKLQAACTMTVADGMVVKTGATSAKAKEGQDQVLEFLLLNHPLDCPVCDKGGECPLQDLTFRYGPGTSRNRFPKRTYEKPLPISPSIVLDRERCILCYRCTRFSSDVAEDGELIARERGARSVIATFEERPYEGVFSGNVTELCPVGALLPTGYRFKGRPWEIVNIPSVCQGCPVGCNTTLTEREGDVQRVLSRNHPAIDDGWLCDRGRFARIPAADRLTEPLVRGETGLDPVTYADATATAARRLRHLQALHGAGAVAIVTGGDLTNEEAFAWALVADSLDARRASAPIAAAARWDLLAPYEARIDDIDDADVIVVIGDAELHDRAGVIDLRVRKARRAGTRLELIGPGGATLERDCTRFTQTPAGCAAQTVAALGAGTAELGELAGAVREARCPVLIVTDAVDHTVVAAAAHALGLHERGGVLPLPYGANERGAAECGLAGGGDEVLDAIERGEVRGLVLIGLDPTATWPNADRWQAAIGRVETIVSVSPAVTNAVSWSHVVLPSAIDLERDGTTTNLEGRVQRLRAAVDPPSGVADLEWLAAIARELGVEVETSAGRLHGRMAAERPTLGSPGWVQIGQRAPLAARPAPSGTPTAGRLAAPSMAAPEGSFQVASGPSPLRGLAAERTPALAHQRAPWVMLNHADAARLGLERGAQATVTYDGGRITGTVRISHRLRPGIVRVAPVAAPILGTAKVARAD